MNDCYIYTPTHPVGHYALPCMATLFDWGVSDLDNVWGCACANTICHEFGAVGASSDDERITKGATYRSIFACLRLHFNLVMQKAFELNEYGPQLTA